MWKYFVVVWLGVAGCAALPPASGSYPSGWYLVKALYLLDGSSTPYLAFTSSNTVWIVNVEPWGPWGSFDGYVVGSCNAREGRQVTLTLDGVQPEKCLTGTVSRAGIRCENKRPEAFSPRVSCPLPRRMLAGVFKPKYNENVWVIEGSPLYEGGFWRTLFSMFRPAHREINVEPFIRKDGTAETVTPPPL